MTARTEAIHAHQQRHQRAAVLLDELRRATLDETRTHGRIQLVTLGSIVRVLAVGRLRPIDGFVRDSGVPFIRPLDLGPEGLWRSQVRRISADDQQRCAGGRLYANDILLARCTLRSVRCAEVPADWAQAIGADLLILRPGPRVAGFYLEHLTRQPSLQAALSGHAHLTPDVVQRLRVPLPTPLALHLCARRLTAITALRSRHRAAWLAVGRLASTSG